MPGELRNGKGLNFLDTAKALIQAVRQETKLASVLVPNKSTKVTFTKGPRERDRFQGSGVSRGPNPRFIKIQFEIPSMREIRNDTDTLST